MRLKTSDVIFDEKIYPREHEDMKLVEKYRGAINKLPPIVVDKKNRIIDGYHRLLAHRYEHIDEIEAELFDSDDDLTCLLQSLELNSGHGQQLSGVEKKKWARHLYNKGVAEDEILNRLKISNTTLWAYLQDIKKKEEEDRNQRILDLYLAYQTQPAIAKDVGIDQATVSRTIDSFMQKSKLENLHTPPESLQYTNHWDFDGCDPSFGSKYPGRLPGQIIENLLWYYTEPFDVVFDPMAGSGTTIDVCKKMYRRYIAYDINPIESKGIKYNDITKGLPQRHITDKPKLIVLDPPYSIEKKGEYTEHSTDLSNLSLEQFYVEIDKIAVACKKELHKDGVVAFMMSALKKDNVVTDLTFECRDIFVKQGYKLIERICDPYKNATSMTGFWIEDAKKNKRMLRDYRDILILTVI